MRLVESIGESVISPMAARDIAVAGVFSTAEADGWELDWLGSHEMSGSFLEKGVWTYRHGIRVPITGQRGV